VVSESQVTDSIFTKVQGTKTWMGDTASDRSTPQLTLYKTVNGTKTATSYAPVWTNTSGDVWTYTFHNLPANENGAAITYSVVEAQMAGYDAPAYDGYNITNTKEKGHIELHKKGINENNGGNLNVVNVANAVFGIYATRADAEAGTNKLEEITTNNGGIAKSGKNYAVGSTYYVREVTAPSGYFLSNEIFSVKIDNTGANTVLNSGGHVINGSKDTDLFNTPTTSLTATKVWNDLTESAIHPTISFQLYRNGTAYGEPKTLSNGTTQVTFSGLPKFDLSQSTITKYDYTVKEVKVPAGYIMSQQGTTITNTAILPTSITLTGTKSLTGKLPTSSDRFTFEVKEGTTVVSTGTSSVGAITFTPISYQYDQTGTHIYTITEKNTGAAGITYDTTVYTAVVTVEANADGTLKTPTVVYYKGGDIIASAKVASPSFANTYAATGDLTLEGTKTMTGRDITDDDTFGFTVKEGDKTVTTGTSTGGTITFDPIEYTQDDIGTHTYTISEDAYDADGVTSTTDTITYTVTVSDNGDGTLEVTAADDNPAITFDNTYEATGSLTLEGTKTMTGRDITDDDTFGFTVKEGDETVTTGSSTGGTITFDPIEYTQDDIGTHTYTISEDDYDADGVTSTSDTITYTVTVSDNGDGTLDVAAADDNPAITFDNTYEATGSLTLEGTKTMTGRDITDDDTFGFTVKEGDETVTTGSSTGGAITFDPIDYTLEDVGEHTYTISEDAYDANGVTSAEGTITYKVTVSDNGDGTLDVAAADDNPAITFDNTYTAEGHLDLTGTKTMTGRDITDDDTFGFTVKEGNETVTTGTSTGGTITFDQIDYTLEDVGDHTYTISEDAYDANGVTSTSATITCLVNVSDNGNGTLAVTVLSDSQEITFENTYTAEGHLDLTGTKTMTGRDITDDDTFGFTVKEGDETVTTGSEHRRNDHLRPDRLYA
jgi:pilin isopeptide linkage protein